MFDDFYLLVMGGFEVVMLLVDVSSVGWLVDMCIVLLLLMFVGECLWLCLVLFVFG